MSTKTNFKRVALVAVAALGLGVLTSVAPASAALDAQPAIAAATTYANVCSVASDNLTAVAKVGGIVKITPSQATGTDDTYVSFTGPGEFVAAANVTYNSLGQAIVASDSDYVLVKATALGTIKVSFRNSATGSAAYAVEIEVVATCSNGVPSAVYSFAKAVAAGDTHAYGTISMTNNVDEADQATKAYAETGYIRAKLKDVYNATLPATGVVQVTATGDVVIGVVTGATSESADPTSGSATTWIGTGTGADLSIAIDQDSGAPTTSTVTISYNGTVVLTKTMAFTGAVASVKVTDVTVGKRGSSGNYGYFRYQVLDSAGNALAGKYAVADAVVNAGAVAVVTAVTPRGSGGAGDTDIYGKSEALTGGTAAKVAYYTCSTLGGPAKLGLKVAISSTTYATTTFDAFCGGVIDTWSISLDKASYAPGEIATLTVAGKDSKGLPVHSAETIAGLEYSFGGLAAVTAPTNGDTFSSAAGAKTYKFSVGTTEGAFVGTFKITGATDTTAKTLQYKVVAPSTGAVTNADVLKAIVSLIASINKQIAALQKALLKK